MMFKLLFITFFLIIIPINYNSFNFLSSSNFAGNKIQNICIRVIVFFKENLTKEEIEYEYNVDNFLCTQY